MSGVLTMKRLLTNMFCFIICLSFLWSPSAKAMTDAKYKKSKSNASIMDQLHYLPIILPVIIDNRDVLELNDAQVKKLLHWREINRDEILYTLQRILHMRSAIKQAALIPSITSEEITLMQDDIFQLQRKVLIYKLSCRQLVFDTFNQQNWEGLMFVLAEQGMALDMQMTLSKQY